MCACAQALALNTQVCTTERVQKRMLEEVIKKGPVVQRLDGSLAAPELVRGQAVA